MLAMRREFAEFDPTRNQLVHMHYPNLSVLVADRRNALSRGPIALLLVEDEVELDSTIARLDSLGFARIIAFAGRDVDLPEGIARVDHDVAARSDLPDIVNALIPAAPEIWFHYCYNAEYLFFPFCEHRTVGEMITFCMEERREAILTYVIDLYAGDLGAAPNGVAQGHAFLDQSGYYALARTDAEGAPLDRQMDFFGGLRWRFEEHIPPARRRIDRVSLFRAVPGLRMLPDHSFNLPEHNTYACPWHNSLTAAICSFRTAKALRRNPGSRDRIDSFRWQNSAPFNWESQQLLDLGLMEPGQWF